MKNRRQILLVLYWNEVFQISSHVQERITEIFVYVIECFFGSRSSEICQQWSGTFFPVSIAALWRPCKRNTGVGQSCQEGFEIEEGIWNWKD